jgi:hypothetical protein
VIGGTEVAREQNAVRGVEAIVYETAIHGHVVLVQEMYVNYQHGTRAFRLPADAFAYAKLITEFESTYAVVGPSHVAAWWGEWAALEATGSPFWIPDEASRPFTAFEAARAAGTWAFCARPDLRGEPKRQDPAWISPRAECVCGHWLCYHVADRLPCIWGGTCECRAFRRPVMN